MPIKGCDFMKKKNTTKTVIFLAALFLCAFAFSKSHLSDKFKGKSNKPSSFVANAQSYHQKPDVIILSEDTDELIHLDLMEFMNDELPDAEDTENTEEVAEAKYVSPVNEPSASTIPDISEIPESVNLELSLIKQYPELPSGCESVALTMLLGYYGYQLDKTTIANDYLIYNDDNFVMGFHGNPFSSHGGGCYAPGMVNTANRFFVQNSSPFRATDITGTSLDDLYKYLAIDVPVMLWCTIDLKTGVKNGSVIQYGDISYQWDQREHCVILTGYNLSDNTVTVYDSISGIKVYNKDKFEQSYNSMWNMAIVIK